MKSRGNSNPRFEASQDIPNFAYAKFGEMLGFKGIFVDSPDRLASAWQEAPVSDRPVVLEVKTDPDVAPFPPHLTLKEARGFMSAMAKGDGVAGGIIGETARSSMASLARSNEIQLPYNTPPEASVWAAGCRDFLRRRRPHWAARSPEAAVRVLAAAGAALTRRIKIFSQSFVRTGAGPSLQRTWPGTDFRNSSARSVSRRPASSGQGASGVSSDQRPNLSLI
jgi:hypothetical protein